MSYKKKNRLLRALMLAGFFPIFSAVAAENPQRTTEPQQEKESAEQLHVSSKENPNASHAVHYSYIGVALETLPAATFCENSHPGIQTVKVLKDSPAFDAGLKNGDILVTLDGQKLFFPNQFSALVRSYKPGEKVELVLLRGEEKLKKTVTIGRRSIMTTKKSVFRSNGLAKDDIRIYINGREISLADGAELNDCISLTPNGILIRDQLDVPAEFRKLVVRAHQSLPDTQRALSFLRQQYEDARQSALGKVQQTFSQVFFGQGNSVVIVGDEKGRQITVSRSGDDAVLFRGACTTQADIDAIPENAKSIIDSFTVLKPMKKESKSASENVGVD